MRCDYLFGLVWLMAVGKIHLILSTFVRVSPNHHVPTREE